MVSPLYWRSIMKRKIILFIAMSLDGYIARKNSAINWLDTHVDDPVEL